MKKQLPYLLVMMLSSVMWLRCTSLNDVRNCTIEGEIIGYDYSRCACCGGFILEIPQGRFLVDNYQEELQNATLDEGDVFNFPIPVTVSFDSSMVSCINMRIELACLELPD